MAKSTDLVPGTLDLLILKTVKLEGWAIAKRIQQVSREALEQQGWIGAEWRPTETGRLAKFYSFMRAGHGHMKRELETCTRLSAAVNLVVQEA
jgi:PadR family transcriptional regulator, regulatory protein PadR